MMIETNKIMDIKFRNHEQKIDLGGNLFIPDGTGPFPVVVIIHGSGTSNRKNRWYHHLVQYLQFNGCVVLLPDKRGSEQSEGDWRKSSLEDLATDTISAVHYMENQNIVKISKIGIVGISQGGRIAPIVATKYNNIDFIINISGASVPLYTQLKYEENCNLRDKGIIPGISNVISIFSSLYIRKVKQKDFWDKVGNFDPIPYWKNVNIRALIQYGEKDTNSPIKKSIKKFNLLNKENIRIKIYKDTGHALESKNGDLIREDALKDMIEFIFEYNKIKKSAD